MGIKVFGVAPEGRRKEGEQDVTEPSISNKFDAIRETIM